MSLTLATVIGGCRRGVHILGQGHLQPQLTAAQFLTVRRYFRPSRELHANPHYLQKYSPWSTKFAGSLDSRIFWRGAVYATVLFGGITSYFYYFKGHPSSSPYASPQNLRVAISELRLAFPSPNVVITDLNALKTYGSSENSYHPTSPHAVIVRPRSTLDVVNIVKIARKYRVPIVPYSGATSLEGHFSGHPLGSICLDMSLMDQILNINVDDGDLTCQAGARWEDINRILKERGTSLFFPLDPGPGATIGGMIGTGCSGSRLLVPARSPIVENSLIIIANAVRYGTARAEWFLNLTVVLPNGEIIKTRSRARKSAAGFDTTKLFIGAEGTLGVVTEATLRLAPLLPTKVAIAQFPNIQQAVSAVQEILNSPQGLHIQCVELLDDRSEYMASLFFEYLEPKRNVVMSAINVAGLVDKPYPVKDTLFFKIQGDASSIAQTSKTVGTIVNKHGSLCFHFAATDQEADELWQNRKYALMSTLAAHPGSRCWTTDVCVPVSRLPQLVHETKQDLLESNLRSTIVGHVGDGNFHALILFDGEQELNAVSDAVHRLVHRAIKLDGTCTGEHGVGVGKKEYLVEELGVNTVELMRTIKRAIDPLNIMNPGKLYPDENSTT